MTSHMDVSSYTQNVVVHMLYRILSCLQARKELKRYIYDNYFFYVIKISPFNWYLKKDVNLEHNPNFSWVINYHKCMTSQSLKVLYKSFNVKRKCNKQKTHRFDVNHEINFTWETEYFLFWFALVKILKTLSHLEK